MLRPFFIKIVRPEVIQQIVLSTVLKLASMDIFSTKFPDILLKLNDNKITTYGALEYIEYGVILCNSEWTMLLKII